MKPNETYAAAWRGMAEIVSGVDMDDYDFSDEVIEAMEGPVRLNLCVIDSECSCANSKDCLIRPFFVRQQKRIVDDLSSQNFGSISKKG